MFIRVDSWFYGTGIYTCLFIINGLGLGNSTRSHAVMEHLAAAGCQVHALTSGNGLAYLQDKTCLKSLTPMDSFFYSGNDGGVSGWATLKSIRRLAAIGRTKRRQLESLLERLRPDVAIIDSEYAISPLRRRRIPVIGLNTSEIVVTEYLKSHDVPRGVRSHFWLIEFSDYLFHKHFCDLVLSPHPLRGGSRHRKFRRIGLIARRQILERVSQASSGEFPPPSRIRRVVFMLSGSVHASNISFDNHELPFAIDVVGRSGESRPNVTFHGRQLDNAALLAQADALVVNGGYSAVSEAFVLRKPTFVVPVPGHAEQFVNARLVHEFGLGFVATETDVLPKLLAMYAKDQWEGLKPIPRKLETDGAHEAAEAIVAVCAQRTGASEGRAARQQQPA